MIKSFADKETEHLFNGDNVRRLPPEVLPRAMLKLALLDAVVRLQALRVPPSNRLEALKGDRKGFHSIRINQQWRICFRWEGSDAFDVAIEDYH